MIWAVNRELIVRGLVKSGTLCLLNGQLLHAALISVTLGGSPDAAVLMSGLGPSTVQPWKLIH